MLKKIITLLLIIPLVSLSQNVDSLFNDKGEIFFSFEYRNKVELNNISKIVSIDHKITPELAYAYANKKEFLKFLDLNKEYNIIELKPKKFDNLNKNNWNYYPTYEEYVDMMMEFENLFPNLCKIHSLGTLNSGREILIAQISDNVGQKENEPSFLYTSSMHGDELAGYVLSLRLIDFLLNNYTDNPKVNNLVNEIDIWINPLANPDGAYAGGNQDVWNATRYNANWVDLNRNYPDPEDGPHPDGNAYQPETIMFLGLADTVNFTMSANMHGGVEVCNYPWDTWSNLTADDSWWIYVCRQYADSCQFYGPNNYFDYLYNGITNGNDWYEVNGGRQDYMNYFRYCREFTLELSNDKTPNPNQLPQLWDANYPSLLNYLEQSLFGVRGIVTDSITGLPLKAKVEINNHDTDSSHVYSNLPIGNYHRYLIQGNYNITFSKNGYYPKTINQTVLNNNTSIVNIQLSPIIIPNAISNHNTDEQEEYRIDFLGRKTNDSMNNLHIIRYKNSLKKIKVIE